MRVLIFGSQYRDDNKVYIGQLFEKLLEKNAEIYIYRDYHSILDPTILKGVPHDVYERGTSMKELDLSYMFCLGGDGTILRAITLVKDSGTKIVGINLGRLGFLANQEKHQISEALDALVEGNYSIEKRSMLRLESEPQVFGEDNLALNDFTILKRDNSSMITIHVYVNGEFLNSYWGDGIIISTPTGSTGYSLSCGGPIMYPGCQNIIITPVAPHHLSIRPVVVQDDAVIEFEVEGRGENFLCTLDSRFEIITTETKLVLRKNPYPIELVSLPQTSFIQTMRKKLLWGSDIRKIHNQ